MFSQGAPQIWCTDELRAMTFIQPASRPQRYGPCILTHTPCMRGKKPAAEAEATASRHHVTDITHATNRPFFRCENRPPRGCLVGRDKHRTLDFHGSWPIYSMSTSLDWTRLLSISCCSVHLWPPLLGEGVDDLRQSHKGGRQSAHWCHVH